MTVSADQQQRNEEHNQRLDQELVRLRADREKYAKELEEAESTLDGLTTEQVDEASDELREAREEANASISALGPMDEDDYRYEVSMIESVVEDVEFENPLTRPSALERVISNIEKEIADIE
ncbi:hypothetical protein YA0089_25915 [Pseudomonas viridiflava]|uniref:hypothetical protein n=1 Tax=Pseudomonas viridiflava TaxID=33069 RepID=UPI0018E61F77|nr:hypothetical protein [Pseudomonas viridiflava]MBI6727053.1 hypothetical protein [Pseudomonas viridiflava]